MRKIRLLWWFYIGVIIPIIFLPCFVHAADGDYVEEGKTIEEILEYASHPTFTGDAQLVDKKYVDSATVESDPVFTSWDKSTGISITESQISDFGTYLESESDPLALLSGGTDNVKDTHIDWGTGVGQVSADDIPDGSTNAIITLTQETNFGTAYTHSQVTTGNPHNLDYSDIGLGANQVIDWTSDQGATNIHAGNYTDTNTTYTASGTLLNLTGTAFSLLEGTLTNGKYCTYVTGTGLVCNSDSGAMAYPGAGIAVSTGSAWGASITNNSANWDTAYGWGDHTSAGYLTAASTGVTGDWTINSGLGNVTSKLIFGRTTGGNGELAYNGSTITFNKPFKMQIAGTSFIASPMINDNGFMGYLLGKRTGAANTTAQIGFIDADAQDTYIITTDTSHDWRINNATKMFLNSSGQLGISTTSFIGSEKLRVNGDIYADGNISGLSFTDRTPYYEGDALSEIIKIKGKDGQIDHSTLPDFVRVEKVNKIYEEVEVTGKKDRAIEKDGKYFEKIEVGEEISQERDLGSMISMLTVAVQQLKAEIEELKKNK